MQPHEAICARGYCRKTSCSWQFGRVPTHTPLDAEHGGRAYAGAQRWGYNAASTGTNSRSV